MQKLQEYLELNARPTSVSGSSTKARSKPKRQLQQNPNSSASAEKNHNTIVKSATADGSLSPKEYILLTIARVRAMADKRNSTEFGE